MIKCILFIAGIILLFFANAQSTFRPTENYMKLASTARHLYNEKKFKESGLTYDTAFKSTHWQGARWHLYNAACSWALADNPGKSYFYLKILIHFYKWSDLERTKTDTDLISLHSNRFWQPTLNLIKRNKEIKDEKLNKLWVAILDTVYKDDQEGRLKIQDTLKKYGLEAPQTKNLYSNIGRKDSINLSKVKNILVNGWPGFEEVGDDGAEAVFLVIQHSDSLTQVTYLPMMREAVKTGKAWPQSLALLEDRILVKQGKMQIYGSQCKQVSIGKYEFYPITDESNVNKRRAEAFLEPIEDFAEEFGFEYIVPKKIDR